MLYAFVILINYSIFLNVYIVFLYTIFNYF